MSDRPSTPHVERLLERLDRRLRRHVFRHGAGRVLLGASGWLLAMFLLDRWLHLPAAVRWVHLGILLFVPAWLVWREWLGPLRRLPDRAGLAVLVERAHPELANLLVSAVELREAAPTDPLTDELVRRVLARADARAAELDLAGVDDPRGPRRAFAGGLVAAAVCGLVLASSGEDARIFFKRIAGGGLTWPRRTTLLLEVPATATRLAVEPTADGLRVLAARGGDVPIVVRAEGEVPDEVILHDTTGRREVMPPSRGKLFRTLLRSVQEDFELWATGGDDNDSKPRVRVEVLSPPDVAALAISIEPPAYTGLEPRVVHDADAEVLAGSRLRVAIVPEPPQARGRVRLLPEDRTLELRPVEWPGEGNDEAQAPPVALGFELVPESTVRFLFELTDDRGLPNPDPGLFSILVREDRPPEVLVLAPARTEFETVPGGALPLRVRATDDFGVAALAWRVDGGDERALASRPLRPDELPGRGARSGRFASRRLEVAELLPPEDLAEGAIARIEVLARDVRAPRPQTATSPELRVRIVSTDELLRRLQDRLARARASVGDLVDLQREKLARSEELAAALEGDEPDAAPRPAEISAVLTGERRVQGDARSVARELAAASESVLYARLDERAGPLLDELERRQADLSDQRFHPEAWQGLSASPARTSASGLAGRLVDATELALAISEGSTAQAVAALAAARDADDAGALAEGLARARSAERTALGQLETLLEQLAEWDNFQSVLSLTRDILGRQKNLEERTRQFAKEH